MYGTIFYMVLELFKSIMFVF